MFEKHAISFIEEQSRLFDSKDKISVEDNIEKLKGKKYEELMKIAKKGEEHFYYLKGNILCNRADYLDSSGKSEIICDIIDFYSDGKILIRDYMGFFSYLRKNVIKISNNPIKTAMVITIIG